MNNTSQGIIITGFLVNILISGYGIARDKTPYSLNQVFWIFCCLFMGLAPLLQFMGGVSPWGRVVAPATFIQVNSLLSASLLLYGLLRYYLLKQPVPQLAAVTVTDTRFLRRYGTIGTAVFISCCGLLLILSGRGLFLRSAGGESLIGNSSLQLLSDKILRGAVLYFALLSIRLFRRGNISKSRLPWILLLAVLCNFPLAVARYWAAAFYIAILLCFFQAVLQRRIYAFRGLMITLIVLVYPVLSIARYSKEEILARFNNLNDIFSLSFSYGDFDAYTSLCTTVTYVSEHGTTRGRQLLTVLLFFVPRSWWPGKGVGSGALVNRLPGSDFTNFCSPVFAEGYINFGIAGMLLFSAALAWLLARYDRYYLRAQASMAFPVLFYPVAIGMFFFMLRGDLLSSFAYTTGIYSSGWLLHRLLKG